VKLELSVEQCALWSIRLASAALGMECQESSSFTPRGLLESYVAVPPPNAHNYQGFVDHAGCDTIFGWAADRNHLNTSITVTIYDNGVALPAILANAFRPMWLAFLGTTDSMASAYLRLQHAGWTHTSSERKVRKFRHGPWVQSYIAYLRHHLGIAPERISLGGQTQTFTANVAGTSNTAVTWSINPSIGSISTAGVYTAPAVITATQTVIATADEQCRSIQDSDRNHLTDAGCNCRVTRGSKPDQQSNPAVLGQCIRQCEYRRDMVSQPQWSGP